MGTGWSGWGVRRGQALGRCPPGSPAGCTGTRAAHLRSCTTCQTWVLWTGTLGGPLWRSLLNPGTHAGAAYRITQQGALTPRKVHSASESIRCPEWPVGSTDGGLCPPSSFTYPALPWPGYTWLPPHVALCRNESTVLAPGAPGTWAF